MGFNSDVIIHIMTQSNLNSFYSFVFGVLEQSSTQATGFCFFVVVFLGFVFVFAFVFCFLFSVSVSVSFVLFTWKQPSFPQRAYSLVTGIDPVSMAAVRRKGVVLVVGAGRGIGATVAAKFAKEGFTACLVGARKC